MAAVFVVTTAVSPAVASGRLEPVPALSAALPALLPAAPDRSICANAHVQGIGWQGWRCAGEGEQLSVGTSGRGLRLEALAVWTSGTGGICISGHVQKFAWQGEQCVDDRTKVAVGTTGISLRLEALRLSTDTGICVDVRLQNLGWQGRRCAEGGATLFAGTTHQSRRMEAVKLSV
jgi:hypothetical protein